MSHYRRKKSLQRAAPRRDARLFVVMSEDTHAAPQYFESFELTRVKLELIPPEEHQSAPKKLAERVDEIIQSRNLKLGTGDQDDQLWLVIDTDRWFHPNHKKGTTVALGDARQRGANVAVSNPCFEVWLYLHFEQPLDPFGNCDGAVTRLRGALGSYNKSRLDLKRFPLELRRKAVNRAAGLERTVGSDGWEVRDPGSHVYKLVEQLLEFVDE